MRLNVKLSIAAVVALLGACGGQPQSPASSDPTPQETDQQPASAVAADSQPATPPAADSGQLPTEVVLPAEWGLRATAMRRTDQGEYRHQAVYEYVAGNPQSIIGQVSSIMSAAGFASGEVREIGSGALATTFRKSGYGRIQVAVNPDVGTSPKNVNAIGVIAIDWPTQTK